MMATNQQHSEKLELEVGLIDCGIANITSIGHALNRIVSNVKRINSPDDMGNTRVIVFPGNGTFSEAMNRLKKSSLDKAIIDYAADKKKYILGICLGMQLLMTEGHENSTTRGLDLINGQARRLIENENLKVPHIGWNSADHTQKISLFNEVPDKTDFYFAHSYIVECEDVNSVLATTAHTEIFASVIGRENIYGVQFHPEKSSISGLTVLRNYCKMAMC